MLYLTYLKHFNRVEIFSNQLGESFKKNLKAYNFILYLVYYRYIYIIFLALLNFTFAYLREIFVKVYSGYLSSLTVVNKKSV